MLTDLERLAAATKPCLHLRDDGTKQPEKSLGDSKQYCYACVDQATPGLVPRFPGLRVPCTNGFCPTTAGHSVPCPCKGIGYTLVGEAGALLVLLAWAQAEGFRVKLGNTPARVWGAVVERGWLGDDSINCRGRTPLEALVAALVQALGLEVKP